jgi:WD repeat-containing protein 68
MSPTKAQQTMSHAPPLLRLAGKTSAWFGVKICFTNALHVASPHDAHLLATFCQDSNLIRILDVRQPGQALLELQGHIAPVNCIEWSPSRRGTLASGGDDSLVLIWDLLNQGNAAAVPGVNGSQPTPTSDNTRSPAASWQCDYEVANISWSPQSGLTSQGSDWLGVSGGRGIWGVNL